jgi:glyoxylase-like metal-dependent hydrolase (beta-lactamase superfamily II)
MERIRLGNAVFEGENAVYLLDGDRTALVDTGVATDAVRDDLRAGLAEYGLAVADVEEVFLTHWHFDHSGLAGEIQAESGATVRIHEADAPLVAREADAVAAMHRRRTERFEAWGMPEAERTSLESFLESHEGLGGDPADVAPFVDGETFERGGVELEAVHLPGHAAGLSALAFDGEAGREAFVGDAVLPEYTPNVGGADVRVEAPLATYAESLRRLASLDLARAWPGHRGVIDDPRGRARATLDHHRERTERVVGVLEECGPCDAWTASARLFGELSGVHVLHGPGEAAAHLDHLVDAGVAARDGREYALVDADPDVASLLPSLPGETKR